MPDNTIDGTPDAVKVACPVWSGGKSNDYFKGLPITISRISALHRTDCVPLLRSTVGGPTHTYGINHAGYVCCIRN